MMILFVFIRKVLANLAVVAHTFNPSTWEAERGRRVSEIEASLFYRVNFRTARATRRNTVSTPAQKTNKQTNKQTNKKTKPI